MNVEELPLPARIYVVFLMFLMIFLWYVACNWIEYRDVANYYKAGLGIFFLCFGLTRILKQYTDAIIFKPYHWSLRNIFLFSLIVTILFLSRPLELEALFLGLPIPMEVSMMDVMQTKTMRIVAAIVESSVWSGIMFPTCVRLLSILAFAIVIGTQMNLSEYFRRPYDYITEFKENNKATYYAIMLPVVVLSAFIMGEIVAKWHKNAYTIYCQSKGIPPEKCIVVFDRVRTFQIIADLSTWVTGSVLPAVIIHVINNALAP